ncbi:hypothetical protein SAMN02799630_01141, partial [Paenibacillus sp. UNCCL117]
MVSLSNRVRVLDKTMCEVPDQRSHYTDCAENRIKLARLALTLYGLC